VAPKEPVVAPKEPVVAPKEPVVAPKEPVVAPKEPVVAAKEPVVAPPPQRPAAGAGQLGVVSTPAGGRLFIDGEEHGVTPALLPLPGGKHRVLVVADGQKLFKREVDLGPGGATVDAQLEAARLPAETGKGAGLKVRCKSAGVFRIYVDGADSGLTCPNDKRIEVGAGTHKIALYDLRTEKLGEAVEHDVEEGHGSTRVYLHQ
jgi:PEGA domain